MELQSRYEELRRDGIGLAAITYDSVEILKVFADRHGITFPLLSDPDSQIIREYGILNTTVEPETRAYGIPFPGTFMLDADGRVTERFFEDGYENRYTVRAIQTRSGSATGGGTPATRAATAHLEVFTYASDEVVAPGNRFSLVLDIRPQPGMHIYAPPQESYQAVALQLDPDPGLVVHAMAHPEAVEYHFEPLDERVMVYREPFQLVQDVTLLVTPELRQRAQATGASLTIHGRLEYQACDDTLCYLPTTVPVSWTVALRPFVQ